MSPWMIVVFCIEAVACQSPDLGPNNYATRADCERDLKGIYETWKPDGFPHAYSFNCRRWPW
jgi:hypothetical protein